MLARITHVMLFRGVMLLLLGALPVTGLLSSWTALGPRIPNWVSQMLATPLPANLFSVLL